MFILPLSYLGPLQLYCRYYANQVILIELHDTYQKQSYRNRCDIYGANGRLCLSIPVKHLSGHRLKLKDVRIDYATDWRRLHWKGIVSAYNSSPYFQYYMDSFEPFYFKEFTFLIDLNQRLNEEVLKILGCKIMPEFTNDFIPFQKSIKEEGNESDIMDLRAIIHPKISLEYDSGYSSFEYIQVFSQVHGFIPNLSILDLIFNMGPESGRVLSSCVRLKA